MAGPREAERRTTVPDQGNGLGSLARQHESISESSQVVKSRMSVLRTLPRCRTRRRGLVENEIAWLRCSLDKLSMTLSPNASTLLPRFR